MDPADEYFKSKFNTKLTPEEEAKYGEWAKKNGKDPDRETIDYDLRGAWKKGAELGENGHLTDEFKKPNHPTFSDQSKYHGKSAPWGGSYVGGKWSEENGKTRYQPSRTMLNKTHDLDRLKSYMQENEPDVELIVPR